MESKLQQAVQRLRDEGTEEEYKAMLTDMFNKLDRKGKRKVIKKELKWSAEVKRRLGV